MSYNEEDGSYRTDNSDDNYDSTQHQGVETVTGNVRRVLSKISVEPYVILFAFSFGLYSIQIENLLIEKTCKVGSFFFGNGTTYNDEVLYDTTTGLFIYIYISPPHSFILAFTIRCVTTCSMDPSGKSRGLSKRWQLLLKCILLS